MVLKMLGKICEGSIFQGFPTPKVKSPKEEKETKYTLTFHAEGKKNISKIEKLETRQKGLQIILPTNVINACLRLFVFISAEQ